MSDSDNPQLPQEFKESIPIFGVSDDIPAGNPWKNDCANRKEFAEKFVTIIDNIGAESSAAILLEGEWGTGKSFFLKSFRQHLDDEGYKAIYFDAFAEDFSTDPLLAICGQLWMSLSVDGHTDKEILKDMLKDFLIAGMETGLRTINLNKENINTLDAGLLVQYSDSRKKLEILKGNLSSIAKKSGNQSNGGDSEKPLVFIIDEMDRCRPTFSLELLERVKHLFQVQGIIFVFGANKESLMKSVQSEYGDQGDEYLEKFFDFEIKLPNAPSFILAKQWIDKLNYDVMMERGGLKKIHQAKMIMNELYYPLMYFMDVTPRQAQRSVRMLTLFLLLSAEKSKAQQWDKVGTVACLTLLKIKYPELYASIAYGDAKCTEIIEKMVAVFEKPIGMDFIRRVGYFESSFQSSPSAIAKNCHRFFNLSILSLADEAEKKEIEERVGFPDSDKTKKFINSVNITDANLEIFRSNSRTSAFFDRSEIIRMLENLDCQS